jgi:tetratricopeptide (TPR) repeat protein
MRSRYPASPVHRWLAILVLSTPLLSLGNSPVGLAASPNPAQLVQQGIDRYQTGDYPSAIQALQQALQHYEQARDQPNTAIVLENIARTYQQLGQSEPAIAHWQKAITLHRQLGNTPQLGRALTEQAQALYLQR